MLEAPAGSHTVEWVRAYATALSTALGADPDVAADVRLAISELVSAIDATGDEGTITLECRPEESALVFQLAPWTDGDHADEAGDGLEALDIAGALFEEVVVESSRVLLRVPLGEGA